MKKYLLLLSLIFISYKGISQQSTEAKNLLNEVSTQIKNYDNIVIDFNFNMKNSDGNSSQDSKGNITLKKDLYVLNFMGTTRIYDGKKVYTIVPEDEEITISNLDNKDAGAITPSNMLAFFNTGYNYSWDILQNIRGRKIQYIKLTPTNTKSNIKDVLLGIDVQTKNIYNKIETYKDGSKSTLTVNSFKTNQPISENHFKFTESKYPNYYLNKLD